MTIKLLQTLFSHLNPADLRINSQTLVIGDALKVMAELPAWCVDLIYVDEAYNDNELSRQIGTTTRLKESDGSHMKWYEVISYSKVVPLYARLLKDGHHLYQWRPSIHKDSVRNWCKLIDPDFGLLAENGFTVAKVLPAEKAFPGMGYSFRSKHECLLFSILSIKDKVQLNDLSLPDIINEKWVNPRSGERIHDSQKPTEVARKIMISSSKEGDLVLEPFAGSFQSAQANGLFNMGRRVIGIEKDKAIAQRTISYFKEHNIPLDVIDSSEWQ